MRTLLQAYKAARDNNRSTGASPCFAPYMELMDEIFGNTPIISNDHTVHVGFRPFEMVSVDVPPPEPSPSSLATSSSPLSSPSEMESPSASPPLQSVAAPSRYDSPTPPLEASSSSAPVARKKRSARELYYQSKLELKKLQAEEKKKARSEAVQQLKEMLKEKWEREAELERRKIELLEKLVNRN